MISAIALIKMGQDEKRRLQKERSMTGHLTNQQALDSVTQGLQHAARLLETPADRSMTATQKWIGQIDTAERKLLVAEKRLDDLERALEGIERWTEIDDFEATDDEMRAAVFAATGIAYRHWPHIRLLLAITERVLDPWKASVLESKMAKPFEEAAPLVSGMAREILGKQGGVVLEIRPGLHSPRSALGIWLSLWAAGGRAGTDDACRWLLDDVEHAKER